MICIGVVIHGPVVIDSGRAVKLLNLLLGVGRVEAVLAGTMGRAAVIDASLEDMIDISSNLKPSESIRKMISSCDVVLLVNEGKSIDSGLAFGNMVYGKLGDINVPLFQIEYGDAGTAGKPQCTIIPWTFAHHPLLDQLRDLLQATIMHPQPDNRTFFVNGDIIRRRIADVRSGEYVTVNGIVIGKALSFDIEVVSQAGRIIELKGGELKPHGVEKLETIDLISAIIRSGPIRPGIFLPRVLDHSSTGRAVIINHCAEDTFEIAGNADLAVVIGDDTTAIAGDLLSRLDIPMIGIIDGDRDGLVDHTQVPCGSVIIRVSAGNDDVVGLRVSDKIFCGKGWKEISETGFEGILSEVMELAGDLVEEVVEYRVVSKTN